MENYNGLNSSLGNLWKLTNARTRSISPESPTGEKGKGGMAVEGGGARTGSGIRTGMEGLSLCFNSASAGVYIGRY